MHLVIGFGNTVRRDDGLGFAVAREVERRAAGQVRVMTVFQLLPEHAEDAAAAERLVLVDAAVDLAPGEVRCQRLADGATARPRPHSLSATALADLARTLYGRAPETFLVTIGGESFDFGEGLTPRAAAAVEQAADAVLSVLSAAG